MRGRSYSPSPPRGGYSRRRRSPSPRGQRSGYGRDLTTSLLVRNLRHDCRPEDLRRPFGKFGPLKDIYLPRDYYTGAPRGFGFVQYVEPADASDAKYEMDGQVFQGRELTVVFAEENRKKPLDMRLRERPSSHRSRHGRRRSPDRYSHSRSPRYSRSPPARRGRSRSRSYEGDSPSPKRRPYSRSGSPNDKKQSRERSYSRESRGKSNSRSPPPRNSRSRSKSKSKSKSGSRSPYSEDHPKEHNRQRSPTPDAE